MLSVLVRFFGALLLFFNALFGLGMAPAGEPNVPTAARGSVQVLHVASADADVPVRDVWVYRPPVPDSATLPVVYFLHGIPGQASDFFNAGGAAALDRLFQSGIPPFVLVAPTGTGDQHADTEWADSVDGRDRVETYLLDNVIPAVEGTHRRNAAHRVLAGFSMGGFGAANLALRHSDLFAGAASFAGYFHIDDPDDVFGNDPSVERANDPGVLVRANRNVHFFLADGDSDDEPVVKGELDRFARLAGPMARPVDIVHAPGHHDWSFVIDHLDQFANFVSWVSASS